MATPDPAPFGASPDFQGEPGNPKRRTAAGAVWATVETWGQQGIQLALFAILARLLGPEAYGLIGLAAIITIVGDILIVNAGWAEALIQRPELEQGHADAVFWLVLAGTVTLALAAAAGAGALASLFGEPRLGAVLPWLSLTLPLNALLIVPAALLRRGFRFAPHAARATLALLCAGLVSVPMASLGFGVWSLVAYQLTLPVVEAVVLWRACVWRPTLGFSSRHARHILAYVAGVMGDRAVFLADTLLPRIVVGYTLGPAALGYYTAANKVMELLFQLATVPLSRVALPNFARASDDPARLRGMLQLATKMAALLAFPSFLGLALIASDLVPIVFGPGWEPSARVVALLALSGMVTPFSQLSAVLLLSVGRIGTQFALTLAGTMLLTLLLPLPALAGPLSLPALALVLSARAYLVFPLRLYVIRRVTGIDLARAYLDASPILAAALLMAGTVLVWRNAGPPDLGRWSSLAGSVGIGAAVYGIALFALARPLLSQLVGLALSLAPGAMGRFGLRP